MKDIKIYSVSKMTVRDGYVSMDSGAPLPFYQEITSIETSITKNQSWFDKLDILFKVLTGKYVLVQFEN